MSSKKLKVTYTPPKERYIEVAKERVFREIPELKEIRIGGYEEVSDSVFDALRFGILIEKELGDGFQYQDFFALLAAQPIIEEIYKDANQFWAEFIKLDGEAAEDAVTLARVKLRDAGLSLGKVTLKILEVLYLAAKAFSLGEEAFSKGKVLKGDFEKFGKGEEVLPALTDGVA